MAKIYLLDPSPYYNHGCTAYAVYRDNGDGTATCIEASGCTSCWQVGHDSGYIYAVVGDVMTIEDLMAHLHLS